MIEFKRKTLIVMFLFITSCLCWAQNDYETKNIPMKAYEEQYNVTDTTYCQIVYSHCMFDPILKKKEVLYEILCIGNTSSQYKNYGSYRMDSTFNSTPGKLISLMDMKNIYSTYECKPELIQKNFSDSTLYFKDILMGQSYCYQEPLPKMIWKLENVTSDILGHKCHKATTQWRGRNWIAWYSDIPISNGPHKFGSLPGLILYLEDEKGHHKFSAISIKNDKHPFGLSKKLKPIKCNRERLNAITQDHCENLGKMIINSGMVEISPKDRAMIEGRRLFYCPVELE